MRLLPILCALFVVAVIGSGCSAAVDEPEAVAEVTEVTPAVEGGPQPPVVSQEAAPNRTTSAPPSPAAAPTTVVVATTVVASTTTISPFARPGWLGTRPLPLRPDGFGVVQPTPAELTDRRLATPRALPPPASGGWEATVGPVPPEVLARSSWHERCPVSSDELAYLTMSHIGFDGLVHTGEMIVNARVADDVVGVFAELFLIGFPIEEMRVTRADEIDAPPTGDGNVTGSFACRDAVNTGNWSQHAYGLAIDINPFHNPYVKGDLVIPELASSYLDRDRAVPGMVEGAAVADLFAAIGWRWGGDWNSLKDWMHFSENGH